MKHFLDFPVIVCRTVEKEMLPVVPSKWLIKNNISSMGP